MIDSHSLKKSRVRFWYFLCVLFISLFKWKNLKIKNDEERKNSLFSAFIIIIIISLLNLSRLTTFAWLFVAITHFLSHISMTWFNNFKNKSIPFANDSTILQSYEYERKAIMPTSEESEQSTRMSNTNY